MVKKKSKINTTLIVFLVIIFVIAIALLLFFLLRKENYISTSKKEVGGQCKVGNKDCQEGLKCKQTVGGQEGKGTCQEITQEVDGQCTVGKKHCKDGLECKQTAGKPQGKGTCQEKEELFDKNKDLFGRPRSSSLPMEYMKYDPIINGGKYNYGRQRFDRPLKFGNKKLPICIRYNNIEAQGKAANGDGNPYTECLYKAGCSTKFNECCPKVCKWDEENQIMTPVNKDSNIDCRNCWLYYKNKDFVNNNGQGTQKKIDFGNKNQMNIDETDYWRMKKKKGKYTYWRSGPNSTHVKQREDLIFYGGKSLKEINASKITRNERIAWEKCNKQSKQEINPKTGKYYKNCAEKKEREEEREKVVYSEKPKYKIEDKILIKWGRKNSTANRVTGILSNKSLKNGLILRKYYKGTIKKIKKDKQYKNTSRFSWKYDVKIDNEDEYVARDNEGKLTYEGRWTRFKYPDIEPDVPENYLDRFLGWVVEWRRDDPPRYRKKVWEDTWNCSIRLLSSKLCAKREKQSSGPSIQPSGPSMPSGGYDIDSSKYY